MSAIKIEQRGDFKGLDVVLLTMDEVGLDAVRAAVHQALAAGVGTSHAFQADMPHELRVESGRAEIDLRAAVTTWRMDPLKLNEILVKLDAMKVSPLPCHHYVDIAHPVQTLILSRDE